MLMLFMDLRLEKIPIYSALPSPMVPVLPSVSTSHTTPCHTALASHKKTVIQISSVHVQVTIFLRTYCFERSVRAAQSSSITPYLPTSLPYHHPSFPSSIHACSDTYRRSQHNRSTCSPHVPHLTQISPRMKTRHKSNQKSKPLVSHTSRSCHLTSARKCV
jgi:hypothetical protein